jgi:hypothetical protein
VEQKMSYAYAEDFNQWNAGATPVIEDVVQEQVPVSKPALVLAHSSSSARATAVPAWMEDLQNKTLELARLRHDWDGRGSAAVRADALVFAWHILGRAMSGSTPPPSLVPLGNGGVQLIWSGQSADVEVEVIKPNHVVVYHVDHHSGKEDEWETSTDFSALADLLRAGFSR